MMEWIPCSERLPEKSGQYLVTRGHKSCGNLWNRVYIINYSDLMGLCKERIWWSGDVGKSDFERHNDVLAWMPLPEPYKIETENKKVCTGCYYNDGEVHAECVVCAKTEKMP